MLKPEQLKTHRFISAGRGTYESDDVDLFFSEVTASYEQMFRENGELVKKISLLAERVSQYKSDEDNIRRALLTAERMADKIQREAQQTAQEQLEAAEKKSQELVLSAQNRADVLETAASVKASQLNEESQRAASERITGAERTASLMISDAERKALAIVDEAKRHAQQELDRINSEIKSNSEALVLLRDEVTGFKRSLLDVYRRHIELITSLPEKEVPDTEADFENETATQPETAPPESEPESDGFAGEQPYAVAEESVDDRIEQAEIYEFDGEPGELFSPDEIIANDIAKTTELQPDDETPPSQDVYDPLDAAFAAAEEQAADSEPEPQEQPQPETQAAEEFAPKAEAENDSGAQRDDFMKGFVISLDEIDNQMGSESGPVYETIDEGASNRNPSNEEESGGSHSRFRGFFKK